MDGYYDPIVVQVLDKPIALCGIWGACIPEVAAHMSSYTGIPFIDLERQMEHNLGASLSSLRGSLAEIQELEYQSLKKMISIRPYPIIALRPETMWDARCSGVLQESRTVYIQIDFLHAQEKVIEWCSNRNYTRYLHLQGINPTNTQAFQLLVAQTEKKYEQVDMVMQAKRPHPRHIAQDILPLLFP